MKRMEEEMNKFRSELINRESSSFRKAASRCANNLLIIPNYLISNSKSSLSSIWKTSYSKTVHSSSESRTIIDGKEVEGSKTSYSARSLLVRFPNCHGASRLGNLTRSLLLLENFFWSPLIPIFQRCEDIKVVASSVSFESFKTRSNFQELFANDFGFQKLFCTQRTEL